MHLAVVIVNYNTRDLLRTSLHSVLTSAALSAGRMDVGIIVIDSASSDGSAAMVAAEFPQVRLYASPENLGYTGGNNLALKMLGFDVEMPLLAAPPHPDGAPPPDFVLLLNADAEVVGDALWQMAALLHSQPNTGVCGAHLRYGDGAFQHGAFTFPTLMQVAFDFIPPLEWPGLRWLWRRLYNSRWNGRYPQHKWNGVEPFPVDFVLGAAMMVRGAAIQQVGGLDNEFFLYCEEMDWCLRLAEAGWQVMVAPAARVIHHAGQSSKQVRWPSYERLWRSRFRFYQKHRHRYGRGHLLLVRLLVRFGMQLRSWQVWRRFVKGAITGAELDAELTTYETIARL
jgi:N-acetylglucosaminyl-diphospho-decaprenol L-rhamnosyltransferase